MSLDYVAPELTVRESSLTRRGSQIEMVSDLYDLPPPTHVKKKWWRHFLCFVKGVPPHLMVRPPSNQK